MIRVTLHMNSNHTHLVYFDQDDLARARGLVAKINEAKHFDAGSIVEIPCGPRKTMYLDPRHVEVVEIEEGAT